MEPTDVDADFRRFVATGDPAALGSVFDALARDLLLVAAHITHGGSDAEDLVQGTFLAAIEAKDRYDTARPVRPWLIGILANQARSSRRRARRTPDPQLLQQVASVDPAAELEVEEVVERVAAAIGNLPQHYRQVLHLRLVHDFTIGQIARALGIPEPTVKSRLLRGTEVLRGALPTSLALGAAIALGTDRLAAMRAAVLGALPAQAAAATAAAGTKLLGALGAGLVLVAALTFAALRTGAPPPPLATATAPRPAGAPMPPTAPEASDANERQPVATTAEPQSGPPTATPPGPAVRGRLVAAESGVGIVGTVAVLPQTNFANLMVLAVQHAGTAPQADLVGSRATADTDGRFVVQLPRAPAVAWQLAVAAPDRVPAFVDLGMLAGGRDLGDIALGAGTMVTFTVVDEAEQPVAGAKFQLAPPGKWNTFAGEAMGLEVQRAEASAAGQFELRLASGVVELQAADDHRLLGPAEVLVAAAPRQHVTIRLQRRTPQARVRGVVQDADGVPIAGIEVHEFASRVRTRTDANGRFECDVVHGGSGMVRLLAESRRGDFGEGSSQTPLPWDGKDIVIVVQRRQEMRLQVVRATTGEPIERYAVLDFGVFVPSARAGDHAGGFTTLPRSDGPTRQFAVIPSEPGLAPTPILEVATEGASLHRVAVREEVAMPVRVVDPQGRAVAGTEVELLDPLGRDLSGFEQAVFLEDLTSPTLENKVLVLDAATTDADGKAMLRGGDGSTGLLLRARGKGHAPALLRGVQCSAQEQRLVVVPGASLQGRLGSAAAVRRLAREFGTKQPMLGDRIAPKAPFGVFATRAGVRLPAVDRTWPLSDDGEFEASGVPPGTWEIHLWVPTGLLRDDAGWSQRVGTVHVPEAAAACQFDAEIDDRCFGAVRARVTFDGIPWARRDCHLSLEGTGSDLPGWSAKVRTDQDGNFTKDDLLVGSYSVVLVFDPKVEGRHGRVVLQQRLEIAAGRTAEVRLEGQRRRARVRLLDAAGAPIARRSFALRQGRTTSGIVDSYTDDQGWLLLDPVPFGPFTLVSQQDEFEVELPAHETTAEWVLRAR